MFKKKYIKYGSIGLAIAAVIFPATTFAGISDGLMASVSEGIGNMVAVIAGHAIAMMIGFLAAVMTTACLFFAWVIDTYLFSVPTLSKVMNEASANMVMAATGWKIAWIAVIVFLFLSVTSFGYTYIRGLYNQLISGFQDREWKMFSQMIWKIAVAFLIFLSVAWVVPFGKAFNYTATYLYTTIVTPFGKDDVELMRTKPIQTLVEVALLLPTDDIDMDGNPIPPYANAAERDKHKFDAILEKGFLQFNKWTNALNSLDIANSIQKQLQPATTNGGAPSSANNPVNVLIKFLIVACIYLVFLYSNTSKLFNLIFSLLTRFSKVIISTFLIPLHIAFLSSDQTRHVGKKNIMSYIGDLSVTIILGVMIGLGTLIMGYIVTSNNLFTADNVMMKFCKSDSASTCSSVLQDVNSFDNLLMQMIVLLMFLWGFLNLTVNTIERVGANFESFVNPDAHGPGGDNYSDGADARDSASKLWGISSKIGSTLGAAMGGGGSMAGKAASTVGNAMQRVNNGISTESSFKVGDGSPNGGSSTGSANSQGSMFHSGK